MLIEWINVLAEYGGVNVVAILIVYLITMIIKTTLPLDKLKEKVRFLFVLVLIPLSLSCIVSLIFVALEKDCSFIGYIRQVLINWSFSGLCHKVLQLIFTKRSRGGR